MMMDGRGIWMMAFGIVAGLLMLGLPGSLIALVWAAVARLRRDSWGSATIPRG
jgi:hypothetical protein